MSTNDNASLLRAGVDAARNGNRAEARRLLQQVLETDDANETAWMWLASVMDTPRERRVCLETVLELNPNNQRARQELDRLNRQQGAADPPVKSMAPKPAAPTASAAPPPRAATPPPRPASAPSSPSTARTASSTPRIVIHPEVAREYARRRARRISPLLIVVGVLLLIMLGVGVWTVANAPTPIPTATPRPTRTLSFIAIQQTHDAATALPTLQPRGTIVTLVPIFNFLPSWTPLPTLTNAPTWTPQPSTVPITQYSIMFAGDGRGRTKIGTYLVGGDGQNERLLIPGDARAFDAVWSPNGKQIAYITDVNGKEQLAVAAADGSNPQTLTQFKGSQTRTPAWSADSQHLAVMSDDAGQKDIYTLDANGANLKKQTDSKYANVSPAWSPDGKQLAYAADVTGQNSYQIYVMDLSSGQSTQLTQSQGSSTSPAWSPNGTQIAFISTRDQRANVYLMAADGSDQRLITYQDDAGESRDPAWTPDGRQIVFSSNRDGGVFNLFAITPDGGTVIQITHVKSASVKPSVRPAS